MNEIKTITAELTAVKQEAKRTMYEFVNPDGSNYPLSVGAFEPNLPQLKIKGHYTFKMELKPTPTDPNKFYKNFVRLKKDGPYDIHPATGEDVCQPAPMGVPDEKPHYPEGAVPAPYPMSPKIITNASNFQQRDDYWKQKETRDLARQAKLDAEQPIKEWNMRRGGYSHDAAAIVAAMIQGRSLVAQAGLEMREAPDWIAGLESEAIGIHNRLVAAMMKEAQIQEEEFKTKLQMGGLKPAPKEEKA